MKNCRCCSVEFEPTDHQIKKSDYICPPCRRERRREWDKNRRLAGLPTGGIASEEWWKKYRAEYYSKPEVRKRINEHAKKYRNDPKLRAKHEARWMVNRMKKAGKLLSQPCSNCGELHVHAHHPDYSQPLLIVWLCPKCHRDEHKKLKMKPTP